MTRLSFVFFAITMLASGCASSSGVDVSRSERRELMKFLSRDFVMPTGHEADVYGILRAVRDQSLAEWKVSEIAFGKIGSVKVYFEAKRGSLHAGPIADAIREGSGWRIGELFQLQ